MSVFAIPTFSDAFYAYTMTLEGRPYVFDFRYNQREDVWYLSLALPDGTALITGVKIVCGTNLLRLCSSTDKPPGLLTAMTNNENDTAPGLDELGEEKRVTLTYFTSDEIAT